MHSTKSLFLLDLGKYKAAIILFDFVIKLKFLRELKGLVPSKSTDWVSIRSLYICAPPGEEHKNIKTLRSSYS